MLNKNELLLPNTVTLGPQVILVKQRTAVVAYFLHQWIYNAEYAANKPIIVFVFKNLKEVNNSVDLQQPEDAHPFQRLNLTHESKRNEYD